MLEAKRTLVKSGPELWAEVSDPGALARHLTPFGSVRIVRTEPETLVAWEGEKAAGAVALEESGFGTRVVMTAAIVGAAPPAQPEPEPAPEPAVEASEPEPEPEPERRGFWARLFRRRTPEPVPATAAEPEPTPEPEPVAPDPAPAAPPAMTDEAALLVLTDTLDALGKAHHRPFSRA